MASENWAKLKETRCRLEKCWTVDLDWSLYPPTLREGCENMGKALNLPPTAVLCGYLILGSYILSPAIVEVPCTDWCEPILLWLTVCMPTGSGKSTLFRHLVDLLREIQQQCRVSEEDPAWLVDDSSFEKMGSLMHENSGRLLGLYDELTSFLSQIWLYRGGGLSESHELALFLQLFNGHHWRRDTVTGEANFNMDSTRLTIGGFTQPGVARYLIELPSNTEKGLSHRFVWLFPKPLYGEFESLGTIDRNFTDKTVKLLSAQWRKASQSAEELSPRVFRIPSRLTEINPREEDSPSTVQENSTVNDPSPTFGKYYNETQTFLKTISGLDPFLEGLMSKNRGLVLRIAAVLHLLFYVGVDSSLPDEVSNAAICAAINLVKVTSQQTAYIIGRGKLEEELMKYQPIADTDVEDDEASTDTTIAAYCLMIPGNILYLSHLLAIKKFRKRGNKDGAVRAFRKLQKEELGSLFEVGGSSGGSCVQYEFHKVSVPEDKEGRLALSIKLKKYNISLAQYIYVLKQKNLQPSSPSRGKRSHNPALTPPGRKKSKVESSPPSTPTKQTSTEQTSTQTPTKQMPAKKTPTKQTPNKQTLKQ